MDEGQGEIIDRARVTVPRVVVSEWARSQIELMVRYDETIEGKNLRILIAGKGCHGFDYHVGFDRCREDDFTIALEGVGVDIIMDPFSAHYLTHCSLDYKQNFETLEEGFVVENKNQDDYRGKFWRKAPSLVPPVLK